MKTSAFASLVAVASVALFISPGHAASIAPRADVNTEEIAITPTGGMAYTNSMAEGSKVKVEGTAAAQDMYGTSLAKGEAKGEDKDKKPFPFPYGPYFSPTSILGNPTGGPSSFDNLNQLADLTEDDPFASQG